MFSSAALSGALLVAGFKEACSLHRAFIFCRRSRPLLIRTGQCFLLNGFIFLGSLFVVRSLVIPMLLWILPDQCELLSEHLCENTAAMTLYSSLRSILIQLFYIFWFYPLYLFSIILSALWYNDIAKHAYGVLTRSEASNEEHSKNNSSDLSDNNQVGMADGIEGVALGIGEQIYSILLLTVFFIEVTATGFIPYLGRPINFLLLSWMYAYYCFEYKWNYSKASLNRRLDLFESNWIFFAGFGSPCVLPILFFSPLVSSGVMAMLYPLFVLTAAGTQPEQVIDSLRLSWRGGSPKRLHVFYFANRLSLKLLQWLPVSKKEQQL